MTSDSSSSSPYIKVRSTLNEDYDASYTGVSPWRDLGGKHKAKNIVEVCNRAGFKPRRVLDVGAGEGSVLKHLSDMGFGEELYALEVASSGVRVIRERGIPSLKDASGFNGYEIPYGDDSFDLVILSHVLEHVEFERLLLREVRRVAPQHAIEVPLDYHYGIDERIENSLSYGHINIYNPTLVRFLLKSEGFLLEKELLAIMQDEVREYMEFELRKRPRTPENLAEFHTRVGNRARAFYTAPKEQAEQLANTLTVLTRRSAGGLAIFKH